MLCHVLVDHLPHLSVSERSDILKVVHQFPEVFGDMPPQTQVIEHDIYVGDSVPITQHPCCNKRWASSGMGVALMLSPA